MGHGGTQGHDGRGGGWGRGVRGGRQPATIAARCIWHNRGLERRSGCRLRDALLFCTELCIEGRTRVGQRKLPHCPNDSNRTGNRFAQTCQQICLGMGKRRRVDEHGSPSRRAQVQCPSRHTYMPSPARKDSRTASTLLPGLGPTPTAKSVLS